MCSINGFTWKNQKLILKMNEVTKHRGPDGTGVFFDENVSLGHNRLSIIDVSNAGDQPMISPDGNMVIIFNGEIYNFKELKMSLMDYDFKSNTDTEVILAGFLKEGVNFFNKLNGIFSFAIWNKKENELILARDSHGIKPLYYSVKDEQMIFSSEIKAILEHEVERKLDIDAFNIYMRVLYTPAPYTLFKDIYKMMPGEILRYKNGKIQSRYIKSESVKSRGSLENVIDTAVERQLVSDKPVGIYLSGGIDSSIILDSVSRVRDRIDTFSVGFELGENEESEKFNKDFYTARETAKIYKTNHHELFISSADAQETLKKVLWHMDEPVANPTSIAMYKLAEFSKKYVDVVLGGDGGDELFGGYERYRLSLLSDTYQKIIPNFIRKKLDSISKFKKINTPAGVDRYALFHFQKDDVVSKIIKDKYTNGKAIEFFRELFIPAQKNFTQQFIDVDRKTWLVDESLIRSDKMSMAHGLEARVPFLDNAVVDFASKISTSKKITLKGTKIILKNSFKNRLPKYLFNKPKIGWFSPSAKWMRHPDFFIFMKEVLNEKYYKETADLFNWKEVGKMLEKHIKNEEYNRTMLWTILSFQLWAKMYKVEL